MPLNLGSRQTTLVWDGNQSSGESNTESKEKTTQQLNKTNGWLLFLETGDGPEPYFKKKVSKSVPEFLMSNKQRRGIQNGL